MKKTKYSIFLLFICFANCFGQLPQKKEFQETNTTELVLFEKALPPKKYNFTNSDILVKWHLLIFDLIEQTNGYTPNVAARTLAYINLAAYESIVPAYPSNKSLSGQISGFQLPKEYLQDSSNFSAPIAINNSVYYMVDQLFQPAPYIWMEKATALKDSINNMLKKDEFSFQKSKNFGISVAEYILKYSMKDGGHQTYLRSYDLNYKLAKCDSCFEINRVADLENTGPLHPNWEKNRTFLKENQTDFGIKPKIIFSKYPDSEFYKQALEVYNESKTVLPNTKKHQIANFWDDAATYTYTAPGHSLSILTQYYREKPDSLIKAAENFCLLGLAVNDAMISCWKLKYKYNLIRPIAYIKKYIDSKWEATLLTPPFPEFPSGHSAQSAAMAQVLTARLGDNISFTDYSKYWVGEPKKFNSFWEAANETSISRLYGGIHFRDALTQGQDLGRLIGGNVLKLNFKK